MTEPGADLPYAKVMDKLVEHANPDRMLALRVRRASGEWHDYWATDYRYAA